MVIMKKLNNPYFKINGRLTYFKIGNCTPKLATFLELFKNYTLKISQY